MPAKGEITKVLIKRPFASFAGKKTLMARIHPTAIIEDDVTIGEGSSIWDNVHIRYGATIGEECIVGEKATSLMT
jgi:carbonic anhydrase/acetyltransferase-like protein (isoleucine patch superfamily)